jgi:hypothetical protein
MSDLVRDVLAGVIREASATVVSILWRGVVAALAGDSPLKAAEREALREVVRRHWDAAAARGRAKRNQS